MRGRVPILVVLIVVGLLAVLAFALLGDGIEFGSIVFIAILVFVGMAVGLGMARRGTEPQPPDEPDEQSRSR